MNNKKIKHNRLRPKPSSKNNTKATKHELEYLQWFKDQIFPCFVCGTFHDIESHHVKEYSSDKKNHTQLLPLCRRCHTQSIELSAHGTPKKFRSMFHIETQRRFADNIYEEFKEYSLFT